MPENNEKITYIGETSWRNQKVKFGIKRDDRRRHVYLVGKTGMGKSSLLENMAIQDIRAGHGVAFVDPHGEAAEKLLNYIPSNRVNDVIYFNPADIDHPIAFNVMENVSLEFRHLVSAGLMGVFKKIWPDVWSARMEYILNNCILALLEYPNATILGVNRMLSDTDYRGKVIEKIKDPIIKSFWVNEFAKYNQRYETEATAAIQNKIGQFISNALMRNIIGQVRSTIDMRSVMDEQKILIVNISKGKVGEDNSRLLGALIITKLQLAAMSRVDIPEEERKDFYLYVDEFQNFATDAFVNILSEARKYRLNLILANQYLGQLEEMTASGKSSRVKDAVFGNVGTISTFRVGAEDAEFLEKEFSPEVTAQDLVNLGKYNIYLKLMIDGIASAPFSATTLSPISVEGVSRKEKIIKVSRERYSTDKKIIDEKIARWTGDINISEPVEQKNSQVQLHEIVCADCGKKVKVVFKPEPGRPAYCKPCFKKRQNGSNNHFEERRSNNHFEERHNNNHFEERQIEKKPETGSSNHISLRDLSSAEVVSFSQSKKENSKPKPKKEIKISELKEVLNEALKNKTE